MLFGSAGATSMLTIIGVAILLTPVLIRTWREFRQKDNMESKINRYSKQLILINSFLFLLG